MYTTTYRPAGFRFCCWSALAATALMTASAVSVRAQSAAGSQVVVPAGATVEDLFVDFLHYARMGRFQVADAYAQALLAHADLDPVKVLKAAGKDKKSVDTLLIIIRNSSIGDSAARVLKLIEAGEREQRKDRERVQVNIEKLGGDPQQEFIARRHLAESGEYAIPPMVQTLLDPTRESLWPRVILALPHIGKGAVNPLVIALAVENNDVRQNLIHALGEIGYPQAIPYLLKLALDETLPPETRVAAMRAVARIESITGRAFPGSAEGHFHHLAERYYNEEDSVRADPRIDEANVWYWDESAQALTPTAIPQAIFGQVMAMRCCEEALRLKNDHAGAIALWLASNIRRESRLNMNVESGDPDEVGEPDATRPQKFPRALYFGQAAGPRYAHMVLQRAVGDGDSAVALGAIKALAITAGETSLIGTEDYKQPLVQALWFPDLVVRIRAALALGAALPKSQFADSQYVVSVLASALTQTGAEQVVLVDSDEANLNRVMSALRAGGRNVIGGTNFYEAFERARVEFQVLSGVFIATDVAEPKIGVALSKLRSEFVFSKTPVVVLTKPEHSVLAEELTVTDKYVETIDAAADGADIEAAFGRVRDRTGQARLDGDLALSLALEAAETLRRLAVDGRTVFDFTQAEPALIGALSSTDEGLQVLAASVLALTPAPTAQRSICHLALDSTNTTSLRVALFDSLAESAKNNGNRLEDDQIAILVDIARGEEDLVIRTAASQALGAINLATNKASDIIRNYYGG